MVRDRDARGGLVAGLGQVGALDALLGVLERVEVAGRQRGDGLGADEHAGVLDDAEHLVDAVVHLAEQPAARGLALAGGGVAEGDLAGRGDLDAHLLLDVGDVGAVALARQVAGLDVEVELGHEEQAQALGAGAAVALDALGARQHEVHDVLGHVVLARGDEALDTLDVPGAVLVREGLGAAGADVGTRVGLGQHHRGAPLAVDHVLRDLLVALGAVLEHDAREGGRPVLSVLELGILPRLEPREQRVNFRLAGFG